MSLGLLRRLLGMAAVAVFFTGFSEYGQRFGIAPVHWIILFLGLAAPLVAYSAATSRLQITPPVVWGVGFLLITSIWYFWSSQSDVAFQEVKIRYLSAIFLLFLLFLFARPGDQRFVRIATALAVLLVVCLNVYELFHPLTFSTIPGRSSGLYPNVNQSGAALVLGLILSYGVVPSRVRLPFIVAVGIGIVTTFSRGAMVGWGVTVLYFAVRSGLSLRAIRSTLILALLVVGFAFSPWWTEIRLTLEERGVLTMDVVERLAFLSRGSTADTSANERKQVAQLAWQLFEDAPFIGHGTGANREPPFELSPHNMYLAMMVDHGIVGLFILPALLITTLWGVNRATADVALPFALFLSLWGLFSHNVLEERYILLAVALVGAMVWSARRAPSPAVPDVPHLALRRGVVA